MTEAESIRLRGGLSRMLHMPTVLRHAREGYVPRFGERLARQLWAGAAIGLLGAWGSLLGILAMLVGVVASLASGNSLPTVLGIVQALFLVVIAGSVMTIAGSGIQARAIKTISTRIQAFDGSVTTDGATRLIKFPQLYDRWLAQHPGFSAIPE